LVRQAVISNEILSEDNLDEEIEEKHKGLTIDIQKEL